MKLKGFWGLLERFSFICLFGFLALLLLTKFPDVMPKMDNSYFLVLLTACVLSGLGLFISLVIRFKAWRNEKFRRKYTE